MDDEEDEGRDDYGEQTVLANGAEGGGGFQEDKNEKERLSMLLEAFDSEQMARYEAFRRGNLNKSAVKKVWLPPLPGHIFPCRLWWLCN